VRAWTLRVPHLFKGAVRVLIARDHEDWLKVVHQYQKTNLGPLAIGVCFAALRDKDHARCALLILDQDYVGAGYVAHEIMHAALFIEGRHSLNRIAANLIPGNANRKVPGLKNEEHLCSVVEHLNRSFWGKWHRYMEPLKKANR
jgi:hypothetical protein